MGNWYEQMKKYLKETPKEQLDKDWEELKHCNEIGPSVDEYVNAVVDNNQSYIESAMKYREENYDTF